jgi:hypothetical protein
MNMIYFCCDEGRRAAVRAHPTLNGIDFLEVVDHDAPVAADRQRILLIHFLKPLTLPAGKTIGVDNIEIRGGVRTIDIHPDRKPVLAGDLLTIHVNTPGDFSTYTLDVIETGGGPLAGLDPLLASVDFSFKVECPSDFDCRSDSSCAPEPLDEPEIDYLAKDYTSFRGMLLDRLSIIMPGWTERNAADLGITLVELLAYIGDYLSYQQDAVATEAYLGTARRRISVRRHARLVDYSMSDGCNARVWVQIRTIGTVNLKLDTKQPTRFLTRVPGFQSRLAPNSTDLDRVMMQSPEVFELMHPATLHAEHNELRFYTWGEKECSLPKGATRAALAGRYAKLRRGDVLILQEMIGPRTGEPADADRSYRHAVRLSRAPVVTEDPLYDDPADSTKRLGVTLIEWSAEDALPFPLCISTVTERGDLVVDVSVALGNIVLADHGRTIAAESLGAPADADPDLGVATTGGGCDSRERKLLPPRFRPSLREGPLTHRGTVSRTAIVDGRRRRLAFDPDAPASAAFSWELDRVIAEISLEDANDGIWLPQRDLLGSDEFALEFVAEVEDDGRATLRFGDDEFGRRPTPGVEVFARYRVGNGTAGNVGAASLAHVVAADSGIVGVSNPLPARGGTDPESIEHVRQSAPSAFRRQERAVTAEDYAEVAGRHRQVQRAAATFRWTGSWRTVFVTADRLGGRTVDPEFEEELRGHLERYRMAGHDIEVDAPRQVPLEIEMKVCVAAGYFRSDVKAALIEALGSGSMADGRRGFFHPDNFTFGQPVYLSQLYAAAHRVAGVSSVEFIAFRRLGRGDDDGLESGVLRMGRLEIARLDNDRNFPENGVMRITVGGGR